MMGDVIKKIIKGITKKDIVLRDWVKEDLENETRLRCKHIKHEQ